MKVALTVGLTVLLSTVAFGQASDLPVGGDTGTSGAASSSDTPDGAPSTIGALSGTDEAPASSSDLGPTTDDQDSNGSTDTSDATANAAAVAQERQNYVSAVLDSLPISQKISSVAHNATPGGS